MNKMTEVLTQTIFDGHRDQIINSIVDKFQNSMEYEKYISEKVETILIDMVQFDEVDKEAEKNEFQKGLEVLIERINLDPDNPTEQRIKSLEAVLFKTSQADRNRLFDHIYEKISSVDKKFNIEIDRLEKQQRRIEKRHEFINIQAETQREQAVLTQNMCRQITNDMQVQTQKVKDWYDEFMAKV